MRISDWSSDVCSSDLRDARSKRGAARLAAEKAFTGEPLAGVGGEAWRVLWDSARRYSTEIAYPGQPFPPSAEDAHCLLCQQPLEAEARARMARFEDFIQKDTEIGRASCRARGGTYG